ncbi:MAG: type IX secretion system protein PorQ [Bacteroidota bacterium]|nr:type IX secretion system protein PorQ [Bacteroidota bacterium]
MNTAIFSKKIISISSSFLFLATVVHASDNPTYEFLRSDVSARSAAMAGSFVSMQNDINTMFYNPAGLATIEQPQASFGFTKNLLDVNAGYAAYGQDYGGLGTFGIGVDYVNYGSFDRTDDLQNVLGTFSAGDFALLLGYAYTPEENLSLGVNGKIIYSSIADAHSSALAVDAGVLYSVPGDNPLTLGISILNVGAQLDPYFDTRESLPLDITIGGAIKPQHLPLLLSVNFHRLNEEQDSFIQRFKAFSVGGEFTLSKPLRFRFGFHNERRSDLKLGTTNGMAGFSLGGGLVLQTLRFDYAYISLGNIGGMNQITVAMNL